MNRDEASESDSQEDLETCFVCRVQELVALKQAVEVIRTGHGQVRFILGEAGSGKTTLIQEFVRRAQKRWDDLVVVEAACHAQTGYGDAYAPFREILGRPHSL